MYLLQKYSSLYPDLNHEITVFRAEELRRQEALEQKRLAKVCSFDQYSKSIWHILNTEYDGPIGYREYDAFATTETQIGRLFDSMENLIEKHPNFGTYHNAVIALRKIGKTFCLTGGMFGHEIRKAFVRHRVPEMMRYVLEGLSWDELQELGMYNEKREGTFEQKLEELCKLADSYCIMEDLRDCLQGLRNGFEEDEVDEEDEEEDEEEDDVDLDDGTGDAESGGNEEVDQEQGEPIAPADAQEGVALRTPITQAPLGEILPAQNVLPRQAQSTEVAVGVIDLTGPPSDEDTENMNPHGTKRKRV